MSSHKKPHASLYRSPGTAPAKHNGSENPILPEERMGDDETQDRSSIYLMFDVDSIARLLLHGPHMRRMAKIENRKQEEISRHAAEEEIIRSKERLDSMRGPLVEECKNEVKEKMGAVVVADSARTDRQQEEAVGNSYGLIDRIQRENVLPPEGQEMLKERVMKRLPTTLDALEKNTLAKNYKMD